MFSRSQYVANGEGEAELLAPHGAFLGTCNFIICLLLFALRFSELTRLLTTQENIVSRQFSCRYALSPSTALILRDNMPKAA